MERSVSGSALISARRRLLVAAAVASLALVATGMGSHPGLGSQPALGWHVGPGWHAGQDWQAGPGWRAALSWPAAPNALAQAPVPTGHGAVADAPAQAPVPTGRLGGTGSGMAVHGGRAYVATAYELLAYDLRDPALPTLVHAVELPSVGYGVYADGDLVCVGQPGGFLLFDVSDEGPPRSVGGFSSAISVAGMSLGHVYVLRRNDRNDLMLSAVDITDPGEPVVRDTITLQSSQGGPNCEIVSVRADADRLYVVGRCAGIGHWRGWFTVRSLPDLRSITGLGTVRNWELFHRVRADDEVLFVDATCATPSECDGMKDEIIRVDASDPDRLTRAATFAVEGQLWGAEDGYVYVDNDGLSVHDARDPAALQQVGHVALPGAVAAFQKTDALVTLLAHAPDQRDLLTVNVEDPGRPQVLGRVSSVRWSADDMALNDLHAYVAVGEPVVPIVDVTWPLHPRQAGSFVADGPVSALTVTANRLYMWHWKRLTIADVSDPLRPRAIGAHEMQGGGAGGPILSVAADGERLYVVLRQTGLAVLDAADPASVVEVAMVERPEAREVIVSGSDVFLREPDRVTLLDLTDPQSPRELGRYEVASAAQRAVAAVGRTLYIGAASGDPVVRVVDFAVPAQPALLGEIETTWFGRAAAVEAGTLLISGDKSLQVIDVSDPGSMRETHLLATRGAGTAVAFRWNDAIVADQHGGLVTFTGVVPRPALPPRAWLPSLP